MKAEVRAKLIERVKAIAGLTDDERGDLLELLRTQKTYGLVWEDKPEDVEERLRDELPVLIEDESKRLTDGGDDAPNHILIEGDNLEALTALTYTHAGKIDVIYIDPPYNTGNKDFIYNDSYVDSEDTYRHSKWLSFMSKRLRIAKKLLSDRGVIFISIDDNEQANLKLLCDEVFREFDFLATIPWRKRTAKSDVPHGLSQDYEWVLCYCKSGFRAAIHKETRKYYETPDFPNRPWRIHDLTKQTSAIERPLSYFTIINPKTGDEYPASYNRTWAITKDTFEYYYSQDRIVFPGDYDFLRISRPMLRYWQEDDRKKAGGMFGFVSASSYLPEEVGMTQDGTKDITDIFGTKEFGFPKAVKLLKYIIKIATPLPFGIKVLDFFAGSGTTMHAVMQLNAEDGGHRQCILVTNNENGICENVTYERNKRVINGYTKPNGEAVEGLHGNNLRYYRTDFVGRSRSPQNLRKLVRLATDMLCIKEDLYAEQQTFAGQEVVKQAFRYFEKGDKRMLIIYREEAVPLLVPLIEQFELPQGERIKVYVFSPSEDPWAGDFEDVQDKVELCALPMAILNAYKRVLPKRKEQNIYVDPDMVSGQAEETAPSDSLFPEMEGGER